MFISVKLIDSYYSTTITLPVVNHGELQQRINDFIQNKGRKAINSIMHSHLCKKLFQKNSRELVAFPQRGLEKKSVSCGDLLICPLSAEKGVLLCFIPSTNPPYLRLAKMIQQFQGKNYPNYSGASTCLFSRTEISFLVCEEGMINTDTNGSCTFQGLEVILLRKNNKHQMLFCQKLTSTLLIRSPYLMGGMGSDYILVDCICKKENFCFQVGLLVVNHKEVYAKVCSANQARTASLNSLRKKADFRSMTIFPQVSLTHHIASFPHPMFLSLPFGVIEGGQLLFSQAKKSDILECTIISDFFVSGKQTKVRNPAIFHTWQVGNPSYIQTNQSTRNIMCFSDSSVTIARKGDSKEFFVTGAQVKLICSTKGVWGICFFRDGASSFDLQKAKTLIPCKKKKPSFVMGQGPSHGAKSSSKCDTEKDSSHGTKSSSNEGPYQGAKKRSAACLESTISTQDLLWSLNWNPEEGTSQGVKKRSAACLESTISTQDLLWSLNWNPEEGTSQGVKKRPSACLGLNFAEQNFLWGSRWNPEEESQDAKNSSRECLGLKCADQDPDWLSSNWDSEEESQDVKNSSRACLGLNFDDQDL